MKINKLPIDGNGNIAIQDITNSTINISTIPENIVEFMADLNLWLTQAAKFLNILVIATTKEKLESFQSLTQNVKEILHLNYDSEPKDWKPYNNENTIFNLICDFQIKSGFKINAYFIDDLDVSDRDLLSFLQQDLSKNTILIVDGIALFNQNNSDFAKVFDKSEIGGCLYPVCKKHHDEIKDILMQSKSRVFENIDNYFHNKFNRQYMNIELQVPTKEDLFRRLTNIAVKHLNIPETYPKNPFVEKFKNQGIKQQTSSF